MVKTLPTGTVLSALTSWDGNFLSNLATPEPPLTTDLVLEEDRLEYEDFIHNDDQFIAELRALEQGLIEEEDLMPTPRPIIVDYIGEPNVERFIDGVMDDTAEIDEFIEALKRLGD